MPFGVPFLSFCAMSAGSNATMETNARTSRLAVASLGLGLTAIALAIVALATPDDRILIGVLLLAFLSVGLAVAGCAAIRHNPGLLTGQNLADLATGLSLVALGLGFGVVPAVEKVRFAAQRSNIS